ncbi:hypothetical protein [Streptomyces rubellomurinus]|uniref:Transcriptional regulator n=1 Tax=Streptomyces rubellomurinus (strain ATCC 31215) TaxID=359131 RepID=A0A0F2TBX5_STRR3|nr:hypothetical protein [Streptomyces rubellomurinus]KJS60708.1 hypothetical protein VM95_19300 [Streptomyces rubellomurinus]
MAARREKVSRWESGRIVPEPTAQLAMAHIHQVPEGAVRHLGWPCWLRLATGDADLLTQPWTAEGAVAVLNGISPSAGPAASGLVVTGPVLSAQIQDALAVLADGHRTSGQAAVPPVPQTLGWIGTRLGALEALEVGTPVLPAALQTAARAEYELVGGLLATHGQDRALGARLLLLAARAAALRAWLCGAQGNESQAERYTLAAIRAAGAAGAPRHAAAYLSLLAVRHLRFGDPGDALSLIAAARSVLPRPTPRLAAAFATHESRALADLGQARGSLRALDRAATALRGAPPWHAAADPSCAAVDEAYLAVSRGNTWLRLGRPDRAMSSYETVPGVGPATPHTLSPHLGERLQGVVEAQLALGEAEAAAATVRRAAVLTGRLPACLAEWFQGRLAPHSHHPTVADLLDSLSDPGRSRPEQDLG